MEQELDYAIMSPEMTVKQAQEEYFKCGEIAVHKGYRDLIKDLVANGYKEDIKNDSYFDALFLTDIMLDHTSKTVRMLTGMRSGDFVSTLMNRFVSTLERLKINGGFFKMILISEKIPDVLESLREKFPGVLSVSLAHAKKPLRHFIVCDTHMARIEELHETLTPETLASAIRAQVYFNGRERAQLVEGHFDALWAILNNKSKSAAPA